MFELIFAKVADTRIYFSSVTFSLHPISLSINNYTLNDWILVNRFHFSTGDQFHSADHRINFDEFFFRYTSDRLP